MSISAESRAQIYLEGIGHHSSDTHQTYQSPTSVNSFRLPDADRDDAVILTVTRDGQLFVGHLLIEPNDRVDLVMVVDKVKDRLANRIDKTVYVRADARARYGTVDHLFSQLRTAGVDLVGLLTSGRNQQNNSCLTSGLEVLIPEAPLPIASDSARHSQPPQFVGVLRAPAIVPIGTSPRDPIVVQVLRGSGGILWKINRKEVSSLNELTLQLGSILGQRPEKVGFLTADETLTFSDFVDAVDAGIGAGLDKVAVVVGAPNENSLGRRVTGVSAESGAQGALEWIGYDSKPIYHTYSRFGIHNILDYFREPPPPNDRTIAPPPPPPPPPPPAGAPRR